LIGGEAVLRSNLLIFSRPSQRAVSSGKSINAAIQLCNVLVYLVANNARQANQILEPTRILAGNRHKAKAQVLNIKYGYQRQQRYQGNRSLYKHPLSSANKHPRSIGSSGEMKTSKSSGLGGISGVCVEATAFLWNQLALRRSSLRGYDMSNRSHASKSCQQTMLLR